MEEGFGFNEKIKCVVPLVPLAAQASPSVVEVWLSAAFSGSD
jgi:hypothetical protein